MEVTACQQTIYIRRYLENTDTKDMPVEGEFKFCLVDISTLFGICALNMVLQQIQICLTTGHERFIWTSASPKQLLFRITQKKYDKVQYLVLVNWEPVFQNNYLISLLRLSAGFL